MGTQNIRFTVRLPEADIEFLKKTAERMNVTISEVIRGMVSDAKDKKTVNDLLKNIQSTVEMGHKGDRYVLSLLTSYVQYNLRGSSEAKVMIQDAIERSRKEIPL